MTKIQFSRKQLCIPYAVFLALFVIVPMLLILFYAFTGTDGRFTFENFLNFFTSTAKLSTLLMSFTIAIITTAFCLVIAYPVAYIIANCNLKNKSVLLLLFVVPMWVNFVLRINALKELFIWIGIYNKAEWDIFNTIVGMVYDFLPFMILPIYTTIIKIDKSYLEAARDLGASSGKAFLKITLPLSKAGIASGVSMVFLPSMTNYVVSNWLTNNSVTIIGSFIERAFNSSLWGNGSVTALLLLLLMFLFTWLTGGFRSDEQTETRGTSLW